MSPRPLHRWKSFWLGLLVLIFLGWAWLRSMSYHEGIRWFNWDWGVMIGQGPEGVGLYAGDRPTFLSEGLHLWNLPVHDVVYRLLANQARSVEPNCTRYYAVTVYGGSLEN